MIGERKMRIGMVEYNNLDAGGGTEVWVREVCRRLLRTHEIRVLTTDRSPRIATIKRELVAGGANVFEMRVIGKSSLPKMRGLANLYQLFRWSDAVYFTHSPGGLDLAVLAAHKLSGTPLVAGHHQPLNWREFKGTLSHQQRLYYAALGFRGVKLLRDLPFHHVLYSEAHTYLKRLSNKSIFQIPYGIEFSEYIPLPKDDTFTILFVGRLTAQKGADFLPFIFRELRRRLVKFRMFVVGEGEMRPELQRLMNDPSVEFIRYVEGEAKVNYFAKSHILLIPSRYEAFGLVGLEALASGTPVISMNIPGPREYIRNGVNGFLCNDVHDMVSHVVDLFSNFDASYITLQRNCRESVAKFGWDRIAPRIEDMLLQVSNSR